MIVNNFLFSSLDLSTIDQEAIKAKLAAKDIAFVARSDIPGQDGQSVQYFTARTLTNSIFYIEVSTILTVT